MDMSNKSHPTQVTPEVVAMLDERCAILEKRVRSIMRGRIALNLVGVILFSVLFGGFVYSGLYGRQPNAALAFLFGVIGISMIGFQIVLLVVNIVNSHKLTYGYRKWNQRVYIRERIKLDQFVDAGNAMRSVERATQAVNPGVGLGAKGTSPGELLVGAWISADNAGLLPRMSNRKSLFIEGYFEIRAKRDAFAAMLSVEQKSTA